MNNKEFEPIRVRIMQEAYDLADRDDTEGYNAVKVMCGDVQRMLKREWVGLTDEERHDIREWQRIQEELGPVWSPMLMYLYLAIEAKLKEKNL